MASTAQKVEWEIRLRDLATQVLRELGTNVKKETAKADTAFKKVRGSVNKFVLSLGKAAAAAIGVGSALMVMHFAVMKIRQGITDAINFSKAMAEVSTISDDAAESLQEVSDRVLELSVRFGLLETEAAKALYQVISAGQVDLPNAFEVLDGAVTLSKGGIADLVTTVDLLTNTINAYGFASKDIAHINNVFFETVRLGKTTVQELAESMGVATPLAAAMGIELEELTAMLATLTKGGVNTTTSVIYLRQAIAQILKPSQDAIELMEKEGIVFDANLVKTKGFMGVLQELKLKLGDNITAWQKFFPHVRSFIPVLSLAGQQFEEFQDILASISSDMLDEDAPAMKAYERAVLSAGNKIETLTNAMRVGFMEASLEMIESLTGPIESVDDLEEAAVTLKETVSELGKALSLVGLVLGGIATIASSVALHWATMNRVMVGGMHLVGEATDEELKEAEAHLLKVTAGMASIAELSEGFGRNLLGIDPRTDSSAAWLRGLAGEAAAAADGSKKFSDEVSALYTRTIKLQAAHSKGVVHETQVLGWLEHQYGLLAKEAKASGITIGEQDRKRLDVIREMINAQTLYINKTKEANREEGNGGAGDSTTGFLDLGSLLPLYRNAYAEVQEMEKILDMQRGEGWQKEMHRIKSKSRLDKMAFMAKKEAEGIALQEQLKKDGASEASIQATMEDYRLGMENQVQWYNNARDRQEKREVELHNKNVEEAERAAKKAADAYRDAWGKTGPLISAVISGAIAGPISDATQAGIKSILGFISNIKGLLGPALADETGGAIADVAAYASISAQEEFSNLTASVRESREQVARLAAQDIYTPEQAASVSAMIDGVEKSGLAFLEAEAKEEAFRKSLGNLDPVTRGLTLGFKEFTDQIPELDDAIAEVVEGSLAEFASGLSNAMFEFAYATKSASEAFSDFARNFIRQVGQMITQMLILQAIKALGFEDGGVIAGGTGDKKELAMGGVVTGGLGRALPVHGYASGGPIVSSPHVALIGEGKYNEAVVPLPDGRSIPVEMRGGGEANISFNITTVDARGVDELLVERQDTIRNLIRSAMSEDRVFRNSMQGR